MEPSSEATPSAEDRALERAYRYINHRERTAGEVRAHLAGRGFAGGPIERAVTTLSEQGYLDDGRFVRLFAQDKRTLEGWGEDRIRRTLIHRGIDPELISDELGRSDHEAELGRALELLRRRFPQPLADRRDRDRALGMLIRKGYDSDLALDALRQHGRRQGQPEPASEPSVPADRPLR